MPVKYMPEQRKQRTPKSPDSITAGALKLPLADRIELCKALQSSIATEVKALKDQAEQASKLAGDL